MSWGRELSTAERLGVRTLRALSGLALGLAVLALAMSASTAGPVLSYAAMGVVLIGPLARLGLAARGWLRSPDRRFLVLSVLVAVVLPVAAALVTAGA